MNLPPPVIEEHQGILVVRDDLIPGGTKTRVLTGMLQGMTEAVYASPAYGYTQVALAVTAKDMGIQATIFTAKRNTPHPRTMEAARYGAKIIMVPYGYLSNVQAKARAYSQTMGATLLPFGLDTPAFRAGLTAVARSLPITPSEVWAAAGSGMLIRSLQAAWPAASFHAVQVGAVPKVGQATHYKAPEKFEDDSRTRPPFPSCSNYDAKAWQFIRRHASPGALFWNVAA